MPPRSFFSARDSQSDSENLSGQLLSGRRAIVTAGGSGIGRAIALHLRREGCLVHVCDIDARVLQELQGIDPAISSSIADVSNYDDVDRLFASAIGTLGGLDFLVNNAGVAGPTALVEDIDPADWQRTVAVNLNGQFYCARRAAPIMKSAGGGAIVNISSVAGRLGYPMRSAYAASKWAVIGFTQSIAMELGPFNIRVNAILPGSVEGDRMDRVNRARAEALGVTVESIRQMDVAQVSMRTYIPVHHVTNMVVYLCSEAGSTISGQSLNVCGNIESLR